jgi:type IV secretion system protein VirB10
MSGENIAAAGGGSQTGEEAKYEGTPEDLTSFKKGHGDSPPWFNRKRVMMAVCSALAAIVIAGLVFSTGKSSKKKQEEASRGFAANSSREFLQREYERSLRPLPDEGQAPALEESGAVIPDEPAADNELPRAVPVYLSEQYPPRADQRPAPQPQPQYPPPPAPAPPSSSNTGQQQQPQPNPYASSMVAKMEGTLFASAQAPPPSNQYDPGASYPSYPPQQNQDPYTAQNGREGKNAFYDSQTGGLQAGVFLPPDILWAGTVIPAVLETAVNTDLPGDVIARVTQNIYDSQTGRKMLLPQGSLLYAKYNSSVSYAQHRVQIVWDLLIRPDGYQLELGGMNGVDPRGMAGLQAQYRENYFEYIKAAGIITLFTVANSRLAAEAAKYQAEETGDLAAGVSASNAGFIGQASGNIISRVLNIQPTLLVDPGGRINIMLNKNLYLPPMQNYPVSRRYTLE